MSEIKPTGPSEKHKLHESQQVGKTGKTGKTDSTKHNIKVPFKNFPLKDYYKFLAREFSMMAQRIKRETDRMVKALKKLKEDQ